MKAMVTLQDLIEEAKLRTVYWALCIFTVTYFLTHTSKSMWTNVPIAVLIVCAIRILCNEVEFRWKVRRIHQQSYLAFLEKKQLSVNDYRLTTTPPPPKWKRKIDSPLVEAAMEEFIQKLLKDFVTDLWYSDITQDKEAPELMHAIIMDVLAEISARLREINLVDLLTRDVVDLVGDHLDLFRRNQAAIGVDVMKTLSSGERDDRLKHHLMASKELHPALISSDCEYKVLQRLMGGLLAVVLRPREAQCPLARCISRELLTCLVMQPVMNFASPGSINELIEFIFLSTNDGESKMENSDQPPNAAGSRSDHALDAKVMPSDLSSKKSASSFNQSTDLTLLRGNTQGEISTYTPEKINHNLSGEESLHPRSADWARMLDAATQRRTEVLMPENLENMWARGRNYKKKLQKTGTGERQPLVGKGLGFATTEPAKGLRKEELIVRSQTLSSTDVKALVQLPPKLHDDTLSDGKNSTTHLTYSQSKEQSSGEVPQVRDLVASVPLNTGNKGGLKRSNSTSDIQHADMDKEFRSEGGRPFISEFYSPGSGRYNEVHTITSVSDTVFQSEGTHNAKLRCRTITSASDTVFQSEGTHNAKLRCRVVGAYFEKLGSKSFAVYSIAVTDVVNNTWFVKRRYRNFERLHRQLKDIPNYTLHLPPKRIFSSSTEDSFVHQRCIQLDKYLQDLLSIANVAEQHEVWDFLSVSSKNYSFGKSPSVMKTLAVNVDDAVDDIVRQFKGVSDGLMRKVVGSSSYPYEDTQSIAGRTFSLNPDEISKHLLWENTTESAISVSDNEEGDKDGAPSHEDVGSDAQANGWHSDNESNAKSYPPREVQPIEDFRNLDSEKKLGPTSESSSISQGIYPAAGFPDTSDSLKDLVGVPPEWTPPNLSVPVLNLVDKMFQLKRRGWLRRQVLWISKQILQLMMEDAIDDWLLRQIRVLRRDDVIAQGIHWVHDVLWPGGTFFTKVNAQSEKDDCQPEGKTSQTKNSRSKVSTPGSFEQQLEATRRASEIKNMMFNGAPSTLVSLIGHKQYRRCARDMYYFLQSSVCLKQLAYGILELVLISVFPELRDVVKDVHEKMSAQVVD